MGLTPREGDVLRLLAQGGSNREIGEALFISGRTVDTHVKTLRAKLRAAGAEPDPIRTHRGLGYSLEA